MFVDFRNPDPDIGSIGSSEPCLAGHDTTSIAESSLYFSMDTMPLVSFDKYCPIRLSSDPVCLVPSM